ncbi:MAG: hypothetical protein KJ811_02820 [Candidatus Margulisbacteria bacterium]|nr:hypothetical protein [Candidatus Margulisiibacteriota bacterium]
MKKLFALLVSVSILLSGASLAIQPEIVGGIRDGLAVGIMADHQLGKNYGMRMGLEATTGAQPLILFLGGKFYLTNLTYGTPFSLGLGFVSYMGSSRNNSLGFGISGIINNAFGIKPMFVEVGVDIVDTARAQVQVGYKLH